MTERPDEQHPEEQPGTGTASAQTGDGAVDAVLSTLDRLEELSVEEHLPLFEQAHEALRRALNRPAEAAGAGS